MSQETILRATIARDTQQMALLLAHVGRLEAQVEAWSHFLCAAAFDAGMRNDVWFEGV